MNGETKGVVYKVYKYFEMRKNDQSSYEHINDVNLAKTVSEATGFSQTTIKKIVKDAREMELQGTPVTFKSAQRNLHPKKRIDFDDFAEGVIRQKVSQWYTVNKCMPSLKALNAELKEEDVLHCSREYLRKTLHRLGFKLCRAKRKELMKHQEIMEVEME